MPAHESPLTYWQLPYAPCTPDLDPLDLVGMKSCGAPFHLHHALYTMHYAPCSMPYALYTMLYAPCPQSETPSTPPPRFAGKR